MNNLPSAKIKKKLLNKALILLLGFNLFSCNNYKIPELELKKTKEVKFDYTVEKWWLNFADAKLNAVIEEALKNNNDVLIASENVNQARISLSKANTSYFPSLSFLANVSRDKYSRETFLANQQNRSIEDSYQGSVTAAYEVDLWGRLAALRKSAKARLAATDYARLVNYNSVSALVAKSYFDLLSLDQEEIVFAQLLNKYQKLLNAYKAEYKSGLIGKEELLSFKEERNNLLADYEVVKQERYKTELLIANLLGRDIEKIKDGMVIRDNRYLVKLFNFDKIPRNIPSNLLSRRPDIKAAKAQLIAANYDVTQVERKWLPSINLTSILGQESIELNKLAKSPANFWHVGASIAQPYSFLTLADNVAQAKSLRKTAELNFKQAARQAYSDAFIALSNYNTSKQADEFSAKAYKNRQHILALAKEKLSLGEISDADLARDEINLLLAKRKYLKTRQNLSLALIDLHQALGGGF